MVKTGYYENDGFIFAWDLGINFLGAPNWEIVWVVSWYTYFFLIGGRGGGESFIKKRGYSWYLKKTHWYPFFNVFWWLKKGYARIFRWLAAKHTTNLVYKIHKTVMHTGVSRFFKSVILVYYMKQGMENVRQSAQWFH